jgi:hypothetical protein
MDPKTDFHPRDLHELASRRFFPETQRYPGGPGKTALLLYAHADEFDRLDQIRKFLEKQTVASHAQSFEIDLSEFAPRRDGPGVPFGALVDRPVTFRIENAASSTWSCEFAVGDATTTCKLHGRGTELIGFEVAGQTKFADSFEQSDRNFVFHHVFALNKALEAYIRLNKL